MSEIELFSGRLVRRCLMGILLGFASLAFVPSSIFSQANESKQASPANAQPESSQPDQRLGPRVKKLEDAVKPDAVKDEEKKKRGIAPRLETLEDSIKADSVKDAEKKKQGLAPRLQTLEDSIKADSVKDAEKKKQGLAPRLQTLEDSVRPNTVTDPKKIAKGIAPRLDDLENAIGTRGSGLRDLLNRVWVLVTAVLVFFMQAGFKCLEVGLGRRRHEGTIGVMNLMNWLILCIVFYCAGFGLMFGTHSAAGWFGTNLLVPAPGGQLVPKDNADHGQTGAKDQSSEPSQQTIRGHATPEMHAALEEEKRVPGEVEAAYAPLNGLGLEFLLFQLAFAATTATIVDGAIAERTAMLPYIAVTVLVGIFIYPVFGHWAWNDASPSLSLRTVWNSGWLKLAWLSEAWKEKLIYKDVYGPHLGFHDFAGSTVVHSVGAWIAWVGCRFIGPRRFFTPTSNPSQPYSLGYAVLGVIMLWFGWWGFNGGSLLQYDTTIASIILNTNLAGASAGLISYADALRRKRRNPNLNLYVFTIGGTLGGLVAITASCDVATPAWSMFIGVVAGFVHNWALNGLPKWSGLDDVAGAIPVHGFCGVWGTLCTGVVIWLVHDGSRWQLLVQFVGALVAFIWAWGASWLVFSLVSKTLGLRVSIEEEEAGAREPMVGILNPDLLISQRPRTRLRSWTFDGPAWSRFEPLKEIAPSLVKEYGSRTKATEAVTSALRQRGRYQVIRSDGTESTPEDVEGTLGNADWL